MPSLRRWRPLTLVTVAWFVVCWYFLRSPSDSPQLTDNTQKTESVRWQKRPERYPVASLRSLPPIPTPAPAIPHIQKAQPDESTEAKAVRLQRLAAVKESFQHSWRGYKEHAWLHDEVSPISGAAVDPFGGWAATLVDSLDILWIMGLKSDFEAAVKAVGKIDFGRAEGRTINIFETTIRYLGGFLAAYELSGHKYPGLLTNAVEVGDLIMCAFDTPNRMPISRWDLAAYVSGARQEAPRQMLIAELGSIGLELTKLSQLTGDNRYYDAAQRVADELEKSQQKTKLPGMWPVSVNAKQLRFDVDRMFTLGGMSDSAYEYLPKQYMILGGVLEQPRKMYEDFLGVAKKYLLKRVLNQHNEPLISSGDIYVTGGNGAAEAVARYSPRAQHLTCFAGGMVGIGAKIFNKPDDLDIALQLTDACVWAYNSTASGIMPEIFSFVDCGSVTKPRGEDCTWSESKWHDAIGSTLGVGNDDAGRDTLIEHTINKKRLSPGFTDINDRKYILRPEAIESVFIMYRITGDAKWMDKAWNMFSSIEKHTRTKIAAASLDDVTRRDPHKVDSMESFWLAETLKYFYLVFSDFNVVDLDDWVLNTEAHPLKRPYPSHRKSYFAKLQAWPPTPKAPSAGIARQQWRPFIRNVRAAKTIADERAVIQKESAAIRASFREESHDHSVRRNNVSKLLYLFTLGERTHFGQIECLKLLASPRFADKRLGHLATSLLLDENQEVLTLVTNSLKNDLVHSNQYIVGLALCTLGNIASVEMSRDLFPEIENLIATANPYIRRKAALCAMRICRKVPDLQEHFIEKATQLLSDRNHGVLLCGLTLVTSLCEADEESEEETGAEDIIEKFRQFVPVLVRTLKGLASSGYAPEHDVTGITDPFLQVKILRLLRVLARGDAQVSEQINDILAQVATNTDSSKNVGNSILYEAVRTILDIEADSGLRVLGVNILGKFLTNRDNNIRYVALNTLVKVVAIEPNAVQRHRNTILECLRDPDISIRRRALELSFTLINESNVRVLIRELLAFLEVADNEFKPTMTSQIGIAADKFAPNKRWHVDTMLRVLTLAGNYVKEQILSSFVRLIATTPELQTYAVQKLYSSLKKDITQESLTQAAAWCIGEYGEALLKGGQYEEEELVTEVKSHEIIDLFSTILESNYATQVSTEYIVTALVKLTTRLTDMSQNDRIRKLLQAHQTSLDVEVQQRAVEYDNLLAYESIRNGVLEKMPPPQIKESSRVLGEATKKPTKAGARKPKMAAKPKEEDLLFDLMGDSSAPVASPTTSGQNNADLLADILGGTASPPPASASSGPPKSNMDSIMDLFGSAPASGSPAPAPTATAASSASMDLFGSAGTPPPQPQQQAAPPVAPTGHPCYDSNGLNVTIQTQRNAEGAIQAIARFRNTGGAPLSEVGLQAAVPKSQKLQLLNISTTDIAPGAEATQMMRVMGCKGPLRLRLRIGYNSSSAGQVMDQVNWAEPA
ncbi:hypothetical protein PoMZ_09906 [Pyricularia oryzae]|uniref:alpha-1,2-Mannosidase n=1 Tax=Pyricularia oryzae TaxID=318829 RepID=A0A4P7MYI3_PYROR|nr:hypothetical protein PoMZ_09906 [Pyricularia oryzae]